MKKIDSDELQLFIDREIILPFYTSRLYKLEELKLNKVLLRKNPYLFKAKNIQTAEELSRYILDAFLSSEEETIFGNLMENLAIHVCEEIFKGKKAVEGKFPSIDLIFDRDGITHIVSIKSGPNWGNSDQINRMKTNFKKARKVLKSDGIVNKIKAVNGCEYGKDKKAFKEISAILRRITISSADKNFGNS